MMRPSKIDRITSIVNEHVRLHTKGKDHAGPGYQSRYELYVMLGEVLDELEYYAKLAGKATETAQWTSMDTPPTCDGQYIVNHQWSPCESNVKPAVWHRDEWLSYNDRYASLRQKITHWMPFPNHPSTQKEQE